MLIVTPLHLDAHQDLVRGAARQRGLVGQRLAALFARRRPARTLHRDDVQDRRDQPTHRLPVAG